MDLNNSYNKVKILKDIIENISQEVDALDTTPVLEDNVFKTTDNLRTILKIARCVLAGKMTLEAVKDYRAYSETFAKLS